MKRAIKFSDDRLRIPRSDIPANLLVVATTTLLAMALALNTVQTALGQCPPQWRPGQGVQGLDGPVSAMTEWDADGDGPQAPMLIVTGSFGIAGDVFAPHIAAWDGQLWQALGATNSPESFIPNSVIVDGTSLIAVGHDSMNGQPLIARWDGATWQPLTELIEGSIAAVAVLNGELVVSGEFTHIGGVAANNIARWNGNVWQPLADGLSFAATALGANGDQITAAGISAGPNGNSVIHTSRWDGTTWQDLHDVIVLVTNPLLAVYKGDVVVGTVEFSGSTCASTWHCPLNFTQIRRWNGDSWQTLYQGADPVNALAVLSGELYAGFESQSCSDFYGCSSMYHAASWTGSDWQLQADSFSGPFTTFGSFGGQLVMGGWFTDVDGLPANFIAVPDGTDWQGLGAIPNYISALAARNDQIIAAGWFPGDGFAGVAGWDGSSWVPVGDEPSAGINQLIDIDGELFAAIGSPCPEWFCFGDVQRLDGDRWESLGGPMDGPVWALTQYEGQLIAGGAFYYAGMTPARSVAQWNGASWQALTAVGADGGIHALAVYNNELIVAGYFSMFDGQPAHNIARWNGRTWQSLGCGIGSSCEYPYSSSVMALAVYQGELIAAGQFDAAGGIPAHNIARWNGARWESLGDGVGPDGAQIEGLTVSNDDLIVVGIFTTAGGNPANNIARWDGAAWTAFDDGVNGRAFGIAAVGNRIAVCGDFTVAGSNISAHWALWEPMCPLGDITADGTVNVDDLLAVINAWGACPSSCASDIAPPGGNGVVDVDDLLMVINNWN